MNQLKPKQTNRNRLYCIQTFGQIIIIIHARLRRLRLAVNLEMLYSFLEIVNAVMMNNEHLCSLYLH